MRQQLRLITQYAQGLTQVRPFGTGALAPLRALEHLGYVQIDTLSVVERAHHHTFWARIPDYHADTLRTLIQDRSAFEYWFHAASILPMRDYRFALPQMSAVRRGETSFAPKADPESMRFVLDRIRIDGPLKARDFQAQVKLGGTWCNLNPAKRALERLFFQGDLMITDRAGMEKIYDLTERVLPSEVNTQEPTLSEFAEYLVDHAVRANGFTTLQQLTHLRPGAVLKNALKATLHHKIENNDLIEFAVDGMPTVYITQWALDTTIEEPTGVRILSPFDNAIIHRDRLKQLFDFDYKLECYVPKEKRKYGYFCLPILYQDSFVGRVDCKVHRKNGVLELICLHIESDDIDFDAFSSKFASSICRFAVFNQCQDIAVSKVKPTQFIKPLRDAIKSLQIV